MRRWSVLLVCLWTSPLAAQGPAFSGIITDLTKAEDTPTGSITVTPVGPKAPAAQTFLVTQATRFETVQGKDVRRVSFLAEHRGDRVTVAVVPGSNPPTAARVQILLPPPLPPPPPGVVRAGPNKKHVNGTIVLIQKDVIILHVDHAPPPVLGQIVDVTRNPGTDYGFVTVRTPADQVVKFTVNRFTHILKVSWDGHQDADFLTLVRGEPVLVYPRLGNTTVAGKVEIVLDGLPLALHRARYHARHSWLPYQFTPTTRVELVRDGKHLAAPLEALRVGEHVAVDSLATDPYLARFIHILLPHSVHGTVVGLTPQAVSVRVQKYGNLDVPPQDFVISLPVVPATVFEAVVGKEHQIITAAPIKAGQNVVVYPAGLPPHPAERVVIHLPAARAVKLKATVIGVAKGMLAVKVHHAAAGSKPAYDEAETFPLTAATKFEMVKGKDHVPVTVAALQPGLEVTVHVMTGLTPQVNKVEVHAPKKPKN